ncbi:hypothetical protein TEU_04860 [Thermococcus eurythermalis]|uniref:DUF4855 domain-containing protein n=1 Tax=Thermococcus eurythermalis TaxID=1505907 RepID=A0A097QTC7_9EURY|nr:DUF4855 domain-containing protein [Thermococcus eurythermalis]AIU69718.1 hypothetical protein TEU_04860 [Thermococcus eurythermalis]
MSKYGLWYYMPYGGNYQTFPTNKTGALCELGFDYLIALHTSGKNNRYGNMPYGTTFTEGLKNGGNFGKWLEEHVGTKISERLRADGYAPIPYIAEIPVKHKEIPPLDYLLGWIEGVYLNTSGLLRGFYWYYEYPWQVSNGITPMNYVKEISDQVKTWGLQLIWIPYLHISENSEDFQKLMSMYENKIKCIHYIVDHTDIPKLSKHFTKIFIQPNYYQKKTILRDDNGKVSLRVWFEGVIEYLREYHKMNNIYMELECDGAVKGSSESLKKACEYTKYANKLQDRAYYFDVNVSNLYVLRDKCPGYV